MATTGPTPPNTEILNLGCPTFQCNSDLPEMRKTKGAVGGMIGGTPVICGGTDGGSNKYGKCFKLTKDWEELSDSLDEPKVNSGTGSIVINDQLLVSGGGISKSGETTQEFVPLDGQIMSSALGTVFEIRRKSLIQHCERSELGLQFEWTKIVTLASL